jgi:hypothetical protein
MLTCKKQSLTVSVFSITLRYVATDDNSEDLKIVKITSQSTGMIVLEMCLPLGWQTVSE